MPKRVRSSAAAKSEVEAEASAVPDVFSKYAYKPPPRGSGVAVHVARVVPMAPVDLAYEGDDAAKAEPVVGVKTEPGSDASLAERVSSFADPSAVPASPGRTGAPRRAPSHDLASCASPPRRVAPLGSAEGAAAGGPPAASAELRPRWREQLEGIVEMRARRDAPVDTQGCERCADPTAPPAVQRFQTLVALMLSSQTKDEVTFAAMQRLVARGCTPEAIAATPTAELETLIYPVGFYRNKAKFISAAAARCASEFGGDIPPSLESLQTLSGVGPKMAHIAMAAAWHAPSGIGVDTHVHRIANRLNWARTEGAGGGGAGKGKGKGKASGPEATRAELEGWMPRELWGGINALLVGFGQQVCQPARPLCEGCSIAGICPTGRRNVRAGPPAAEKTA